MKKLTIASTVLAASMCMGTQSVMAAGSLDEQDMLFAFGSGNSMETVILSEQEMVETEGSWWFAPVIAYTVGGGFAGAAAYAWNTPSNSWGWGNAGRAFGAGATAGFYSSPMGRPLGAAGRTVAGAFGSASWYNW